jgi:hypothetical protein
MTVKTLRQLEQRFLADRLIDVTDADHDVQVNGFEARAALSREIDTPVDVPGPVSARGLWVGGQFISRAPATTRKAFEANFQALPAGAVDPMACAYSPGQWSRVFTSRGLEAAAFGPSW